MTPLPVPKAFFSYAWTSEAHKARVKALVDRLRVDGVDAMLDQTHLRDGDDLYHFMERIASDPLLKKVVAVCDQRYQVKVDGREGGSGTEGSIMSPEVYAQIGEGPNKYVAVVFETDDRGRGYVPAMFASRLHIDMSTDELLDRNYDRLLRFLHDRPEPPVPIGTPPAFLFEDDPGDVQIHAKARLVRQAVERGRGVLTPWAEFRDAVLAVFDRFHSPSSNGHYDAQIAAQQLTLTLPARDALVDVVRFLVREDLLTVRMLLGLLEPLGNLWWRHRTQWKVQPEETAHTRMAVMELTLYLAAVLMQEDRPDLLGGLLAAPYLARQWDEQVATEFGFLRKDTRYLARAFPGRVTQEDEAQLTHLVLSDRATLQSVSWDDLMQADALLTVGSMAERRLQPDRYPEAAVWRPALPYAWRAQKLPLFLRLNSRAEIERWLPVFRVPDVATFLNTFDQIIRIPGASGVLGGANPRHTFDQSNIGTRP
ncbi:toll/interleukin-1 receptor domain-containing protein [Deinococcus multiflagellatus]|uniref:Toll/interleukin-1 receptor domain-containing protein n=1 Tax=Deinococcus multiflagellatus TaxID=1656887 RepID=A0ABW1ZS93_9DEIO|nr:toll/interleukin-1 receptor domain-containing protein [Deinococcus multiflagellatus]MBZ9714909.1 toll/interleukin-1 receptor domain-containing protein [Deinococcus multiflagellatus]